MALSPFAGKPAPVELLVDVTRLEEEYFERKPDLGDANQLVSFGTSGHRGSPLHGSFTEAHILAITQAICDYRRGQGTDGSFCFGGEESAGASFLRHDGTAWTTDKDGPIMNLLAAEIAARTGKDPGEHYRELTAEFGAPSYTRIDAPATLEQKARLGRLSPEAVTAATLAGEPIAAKLTRAPGNNAPIGGLKVVAANGWFAARPSGTENIYKIYAESFKDERHLEAIVNEAREIVDSVLRDAG